MVLVEVVGVIAAVVVVVLEVGARLPLATEMSERPLGRLVHRRQHSLERGRNLHVTLAPARRLLLSLAAVPAAVAAVVAVAVAVVVAVAAIVAAAASAQWSCCC